MKWFKKKEKDEYIDALRKDGRSSIIGEDLFLIDKLEKKYPIIARHLIKALRYEHEIQRYDDPILFHAKYQEELKSLLKGQKK